jgi:biopolymer transport protein ExbD
MANKQRKPSIIPVEVDMVPLIDIVSLLLMFLVIVGETSKSATNVKMNLPRCDMAKPDRDLADTKGRIVVQMKMKDGKYVARIANADYDLVQGGANATLVRYLEEQIAKGLASGAYVIAPDGSVPFPVKLRAPQEAPMREVERLIQTLAQAKLVNVHYAAEKLK